MKKIAIASFAVMAVIVLSGCFGSQNQNDQEASNGGTNGASSVFPTPSDAMNLQDQSNGTGNEGINFQTMMPLGEVLSFYRGEFSNLQERELNTVETDTTLNLIFDGHENGKAIVIQAVALPEGKTNINMRFEEI